MYVLFHNAATIAQTHNDASMLGWLFVTLRLQWVSSRHRISRTSAYGQKQALAKLDLIPLFPERNRFQYSIFRCVA